MAYSLPTSSGAVSEDPKQVLKQARDATYSLTDHGLKGFRCTVHPDWISLYASIKADDVGRDDLLPILQKVSLKAVLGPTGASTISHDSDAAPPSEQLAERMRGSINGMEQVLTGFFTTWSGMMFKSPLPAGDSVYQLTDVESGYKLMYKEGNSDVIALIDRKFAISDLEVTSAQLRGDLLMQWVDGKQGLLLAGYDATYKTDAGAGKLSVKIEYREVNGFTLPAVVAATVPIGSDNAVVSLSFTDYQVETR